MCVARHCTCDHADRGVERRDAALPLEAYFFAGRLKMLLPSLSGRCVLSLGFHCCVCSSFSFFLFAVLRFVYFPALLHLVGFIFLPVDSCHPSCWEGARVERDTLSPFFIDGRCLSGRDFSCSHLLSFLAVKICEQCSKKSMCFPLSRLRPRSQRTVRALVRHGPKKQRVQSPQRGEGGCSVEG